MRWQRPWLDLVIVAILNKFLRAVAAISIEYKHTPCAFLSQFRVLIEMIKPVHCTLVVVIASVAYTDKGVFMQLMRIHRR